MIPLKDDNPRRTTPFVTIALVIVNVIAFLYQVSLGPQAGQEFIFEFGMIPAKLPALLHGEVPFSLKSLEWAFSPILSSMFLHGGWMHLIGNMWFFWIFGDNVEDAFGHFKFLLFYLLCGVGAGLTHALLNPHSMVPTIGASGAISGVMGAYIVLYPGARVLTLVPLVVFFFTIRLPAMLILGYWFVLQFLSGLGSLGTSSEGGGTAFWAHVGGFAIGALIAGVVKDTRAGD
jgi:membrane associated rhomboid family serine protease